MKHIPVSVQRLSNSTIHTWSSPE